jgi:hypothetical protein
MDVDVRDAVESDADQLAAIVDVPVEVMRNVVHDRTVRVAEREQGGTDPNVDTETTDADILGFVSFDVRDQTVHVTQLGGAVDACETLLSEPVRFATNEGLTVESVVSESDERAREALQRAGFTDVGPGPTFDGGSTVRYRLDPN